MGGGRRDSKPEKRVEFSFFKGLYRNYGSNKRFYINKKVQAGMRSQEMRKFIGGEGWINLPMVLYLLVNRDDVI
ncbi:MAG TPA: hypothetical protein PK358_12050 [Spirochaetota bacterium]|nr:hypothetical protein [Spirochaetota bacterium]HPJ35563.1 hypothetical protein [Spirochaetota bacterium]